MSMCFQDSGAIIPPYGCVWTKQLMTASKPFSHISEGFPSFTVSIFKILWKCWHWDYFMIIQGGIKKKKRLILDWKVAALETLLWCVEGASPNVHMFSSHRSSKTMNLCSKCFAGKSFTRFPQDADQNFQVRVVFLEMLVSTQTFFFTSSCLSLSLDQLLTNVAGRVGRQF